MEQFHQKKLGSGLIFFIGWVLSPFTWWNDALVNIPLSYLLANLIFCATHLPFRYLLIGSYWFTNILGVILMYAAGKRLILSSKQKLKASLTLLIAVVIYTAIMIYLGREGRLLPLSEFLRNKF